MNPNPDLARVLLAIFLWLIGFLLHFVGNARWNAPRWFCLLLGVWKNRQKVSKIGALWQLLGYEVLFFVNPLFFPDKNVEMAVAIFFALSYIANIFLVKSLLKE